MPNTGDTTVRVDLRSTFWDEIEKIAEKDKDIIVLTGDLGYSFMEKFQKRFPDRFINCGVAEQNMVGLAAGLALAGKKPVVYTGSVFLQRAAEQIRDDVAWNNLKVLLIGTGASQFLGFTHNLWGDEDEMIFKAYPKLMRCFPEKSDSPESALRMLMNRWLEDDMAYYIRI